MYDFRGREHRRGRAIERQRQAPHGGSDCPLHLQPVAEEDEAEYHSQLTSNQVRPANITSLSLGAQGSRSSRTTVSGGIQSSVGGDQRIDKDHHNHTTVNHNHTTVNHNHTTVNHNHNHYCTVNLNGGWVFAIVLFGRGDSLIMRCT
ncbi:hypothetical protein BT96DRAFT_923900, partial [Gymnopus androsaceus JB14]